MRNLLLHLVVVNGELVLCKPIDVKTAPVAHNHINSYQIGADDDSIFL